MILPLDRPLQAPTLKEPRIFRQLFTSRDPKELKVAWQQAYGLWGFRGLDIPEPIKLEQSKPCDLLYLPPELANFEHVGLLTRQAGFPRLYAWLPYHIAVHHISNPRPLAGWIAPPREVTRETICELTLNIYLLRAFYRQYILEEDPSHKDWIPLHGTRCGRQPIWIRFEDTDRRRVFIRPCEPPVIMTPHGVSYLPG